MKLHQQRGKAEGNHRDEGNSSSQPPQEQPPRLGILRKKALPIDHPVVVVLKVWSGDPRHQRHLATCYKGRFLRPHPRLLMG